MVQKWHLKPTVFFFFKILFIIPSVNMWVAFKFKKKLALLVVHETKIRQKLEFWKALKSMSSNAPFHSGCHCLHHASMWCKIIWKLILQLCLGFIQYSLKVLQKRNYWSIKKNQVFSNVPWYQWEHIPVETQEKQGDTQSLASMFPLVACVCMCRGGFPTLTVHTQIYTWKLEIPASFLVLRQSWIQFTCLLFKLCY